MKLLFIALVLFGFGFSGTDGHIKGKVVSDKGKPINNCEIDLLGSSYEVDLSFLQKLKNLFSSTKIRKKVERETIHFAKTNINGEYFINNIRVGTYDVRCKCDGYETLMKVQTIQMEETQELNFLMITSLITYD